MVLILLTWPHDSCFTIHSSLIGFLFFPCSCLRWLENSLTMEMRYAELLSTLEESKRGFPFGPKMLPTKLLRLKIIYWQRHVKLSLFRLKGLKIRVSFDVAGEHWETMEGVYWLQQQHRFHHPCKKRASFEYLFISFFFNISLSVLVCFFLQEDAKKLDRGAKSAYTAWNPNNSLKCLHRFKYSFVCERFLFTFSKHDY